MAIGPRAEDIPRIRAALIFYRVSAAVTGVFLLLLVVMMVARYGFHSDLALFDGSIMLLERVEQPGVDPTGFWPPAAVNLSTIILIVHGWLYVVYLVADFALWRLVRYSFLYFCFVALGGVIPFISFYFEWRVPKDVHARTAALKAPPEPQEVQA